MKPIGRTTRSALGARSRPPAYERCWRARHIAAGARLTVAEYAALVRLAGRINALTAEHGIAPAEAERLARAELGAR